MDDSWYSAMPYQLWHLKPKAAISAISLSCGANEGFLRQLWIWCKHCNAKSPVLGTGFLVGGEREREGSIQCNAWSALAPVLGLTWGSHTAKCNWKKQLESSGLPNAYPNYIALFTLWCYETVNANYNIRWVWPQKVLEWMWRWIWWFILLT